MYKKGLWECTWKTCWLTVISWDRGTWERADTQYKTVKLEGPQRAEAVAGGGIRSFPCAVSMLRWDISPELETSCAFLFQVWKAILWRENRTTTLGILALPVNCCVALGKLLTSLSHIYNLGLVM